MSEQRFDPIKEITNLGETISKTIEKGIKSVTGTVEHQISMDVYESKNNLIIRTVPLDGLVKDSIEIGIEDNMLTIEVKTEPEVAPVDAAYLMQERRFGRLSRTLALPMAVKADKAKAKVDGASLVVTLPIDEQSQSNITVTPVE